MTSVPPASVSPAPGLSVAPAGAEGEFLSLSQVIALHRQGDLAAAESGYRQLLAAMPDHPNLRHLLAQLLLHRGAGAEALSILWPALEAYPDVGGYRDTLAHILRARGLETEATLQWEAAAILDPDEADAHYHLGARWFAAGWIPAAVTAFTHAVRLAPDHARAWNNLGLSCDAVQDQAGAAAAFQQAAALQPADPTIGINQARWLARQVPFWHTPMMNDDARNQAYETALRRAVRPHHHVLEIGTGAGLLALMAARAGARRVTTCEREPAVAAVAQEIVARNGYGATIRVLNRDSTTLDPQADLGGPADILVSEILSNELLGEGVLDSVEDALRRLVGPEPVIIPAAIALEARLVGGAALAAQVWPGEIAGFDMTPFAAVQSRRVGINLQAVSHVPFSADFTAFSFDFRRQRHFPAERRQFRITATASGLCYGILVWLRLELDSQTVFRNHPDHPSPASGWQHTVFRLETPCRLETGQRVCLTAAHDRTFPWFHLEIPAAGSE